MSNAIASNTIRCKLNINQIKDVGSSLRVEMGAVYSSRPDTENKSFADATPAAYFYMDVSKKAPAAYSPWLVPGAQVYVDISLADIPEWNWSADRYPEEGRKIEIRINELTADPVIGTFVKQVDAEFKQRGNNEYKYPLLLLDDCGEDPEQQFKLYTNTQNWFQYYWKYID